VTSLYGATQTMIQLQWSAMKYLVLVLKLHVLGHQVGVSANAELATFSNHDHYYCLERNQTSRHFFTSL